MSKIDQSLHKDSWKHKEQLSFLAQLQIPKGLQVINSGTKNKIETSSNFKGVQTFLKKSDKFYLPKLDLKIILHWHTCIRILKVHLQVRIGTAPSITGIPLIQNGQIMF
jgi:hypothetical protein